MKVAPLSPRPSWHLEQRAREPCHFLVSGQHLGRGSEKACVTTMGLNPAVPSPCLWAHVKMPFALLPLQQVLMPIWVPCSPLLSNFGGCGDAGTEGHCAQA